MQPTVLLPNPCQLLGKSCVSPHATAHFHHGLSSDRSEQELLYTQNDVM